MQKNSIHAIRGKVTRHENCTVFEYCDSIETSQ